MGERIIPKQETNLMLCNYRVEGIVSIDMILPIHHQNVLLATTAGGSSILPVLGAWKRKEILIRRYEYLANRNRHIARSERCRYPLLLLPPLVFRRWFSVRGSASHRGGVRRLIAKQCCAFRRPL